MKKSSLRFIFSFTLLLSLMMSTLIFPLNSAFAVSDTALEALEPATGNEEDLDDTLEILEFIKDVFELFGY